MWVLIDNYDSFTWILQHYLLQTGNDCKVYRNDEITIAELEQLNPERLIISPGPETPLQAGISMQAIATFCGRIPILGVCLGHQALGMHFGAQLRHAGYPMHGKVSEISHTSHILFRDIPARYSVMRYHSLVIDRLEDTGLQAIASTSDGTVMAISHIHLPCIGVQFHPESVGTQYGLKLLQNWDAMYR